MPPELQFEKYTPASEITVLAVCFIMLMLLIVSFKVRMKSYRIFGVTLGMLIAATSSDLMLHYLIDKAPGLPVQVFYGLRCLYRTSLAGNLRPSMKAPPGSLYPDRTLSIRSAGKPGSRTP